MDPVNNLIIKLKLLVVNDIIISKESKKNVLYQNATKIHFRDC